MGAVLGGGGGGGESASAGQKDWVKSQYERLIMKLKILCLGFPTYTCTFPHRALSCFLPLLCTVQNKKCSLSSIQW